MTEFVDPRSSPEPPARVSREPAAHGEELRELLGEALKIRAFDLLDLLLKWGADPTKVRTFYVVETYKTDLIDRFWTAGVDYTADREFVLSRARTVNKPLYGWLRRERADQRLYA